MDFKTFYLAMSVNERETFALQAGTTRGTCNQIAYAGKQIELGLADVFIALAGGVLTLDMLPLTDRAVQQRAIRDGSHAAPASVSGAAKPADEHGGGQVFKRANGEVVADQRVAQARPVEVAGLTLEERRAASDGKVEA